MSGQIPSPATLLPVRFEPARGESASSYCRRLSQANGLTTKQLVGICGSEPWRSDEAMQALADRAGIELDELVSLTLESVRASLRNKPSGWRLKSTVWECNSCASRGIEQALRGFSIQFLCLRCETFLNRPEEQDEPAIAATEDLVALQRELLDAIPARDHKAIASRFKRLRHLVKTFSRTLTYEEVNTLGLSEADSSLDADWRESRPIDFPLCLPEAPRVVGAVLSKTWEQTASTNVLFLQTRALRNINPREFRRARIHYKFMEIDPADCMQGFPSSTVEKDAIGEHIRDLVRRGLRSAHVPEEVRYQSDPFILDATTWHWRRHVCLHLRRWLLQIELTGEVISSRRDQHPVPEAIDKLLGKLKRSVHSREAIVGEYFTSVTARTVLSQMLKLADDTVCKVTSYAEPRVHLSRESLKQIAPSANRFGQRGIHLARAWMWLDEIADKDAYGYLPMIRPSSMERFDNSLRPEERLSLREYRIQQQEVLADDIAPHKAQTISALRDA